MQIAIIGAGFTGLAAGLRLQQKGHQVTIFEKESELGGLASGFSNSSWLWTLERNYHHWFTNDKTILKLADELGHKVITKRPSTDVYVNGKIMPFDSIYGLLTFTPLPFIDRLRVGITLLYLKLNKNHQKFDQKLALPWIKRFMGAKATKMIWEPLFSGKFGPFKDGIALTWLWARIKKRTPKLAYPRGGFKVFADVLRKKIIKIGGEVLMNAPVVSISVKKGVQIKTSKKTFNFDKVIVTLPSPVFTRITRGLPRPYIKKIGSISHFNALVTVLILKKPFMKKSYWLNITDKSFPFVMLAEHTNFMNPKNYGNQHILYIGNYLSPGHPYLKMSPKELLKIFDPYLKKINPDYRSSLVDYHKFVDFFAQPIVSTNYQELIPKFKTPLANVYLANLDMVYPWDRGTNYAIEMGEKIAKIL